MEKKMVLAHNALLHYTSPCFLYVILLWDMLEPNQLRRQYELVSSKIKMNAEFSLVVLFCSQTDTVKFRKCFEMLQKTQAATNSSKALVQLQRSTLLNCSDNETSPQEQKFTKLSFTDNFSKAFMCIYIHTRMYIHILIHLYMYLYT